VTTFWLLWSGPLGLVIYSVLVKYLPLARYRIVRATQDAALFLRVAATVVLLV